MLGVVCVMCECFVIICNKPLTLRFKCESSDLAPSSAICMKERNRGRETDREGEREERESERAKESYRALLMMFDTRLPLSLSLSLSY